MIPILVDTIEYTGRDRPSWLQVVDSREVTAPGRSPKPVPTLVTRFPVPVHRTGVVSLRRPRDNGEGALQ
jgi:hypothetical protein